jgi:hypothetical protein
LLVAVGVLMLTAGTAGAATKGEFGQTRYLPVQPPPRGAELVSVGIEPISFDEIDPAQQSFKASFYVWWRWRGSIDPVPTTDIVNSAAASTRYVVNYSYTTPAGKEKPTKLDNGDSYQAARVSTGINQPFSVGRYPLDKQQLLIRIENNTYNNNELVYVPDTANMAREPELEVSGWDVTGVSLRPLFHQYGTNFGDVASGPAASQYSQLVYDVNIKRPVSHFLVKLYIPLLVIFSLALSALLVKEDRFDVRLVMVGTGLLTLILLQLGYGPDLPSTAPAVLMDDIYIAAYVGLGLTFLRVIYTANQIHHLEQARHNYIRMDRVLAGALWSGFVLASILLVALVNS